MVNKIILLLLILVCTSCASQRSLTREEWLKAGVREYTGVKKEFVISKAEELFKLMDNDDVKFSYTQNGFVASRTWLIYAVLAASVGTDYWTFDVQEKDDKLIATVQPSTMVGTISSYSTGNQVSTITTPTIGSPIQGTAIYDMFWSRLDYLVGKTDIWMDCNKALLKIKTKENWGNLDNGCNSITISDDYPDNLSNEEIDRIFATSQAGKYKYLKKHRPELYNKLSSESRNY